MTVAGMRGSNNMYLLDGVSNGDFTNNAQSATTGYTGAETIKEFQVITNNYFCRISKQARGNRQCGHEVRYESVAWFSI